MSIANPTPLLSLELQVDGSNANTWNQRYNANFQRIEAAIGGAVNVDVSTGAATLTTADSGSDFAVNAQDRAGTIIFTGSPVVPATVTLAVATSGKFWQIVNFTAQVVTFKVAGQTGIPVLPNKRRRVWCNGTDIVEDITSIGLMNSDFSGFYLNVDTGVNPIPSNVTGLAYIGGSLWVQGVAGGNFGIPSGSGVNVVYYNGGNQVGSISTTPGTTSFNTTSDRRLKTEHGSYRRGLADLSAIPVRNCAFKSLPGDIRPMLFADEVQNVAPWAVRGEKNGPEFQQVDHSALVPMLIAAIRELQREIDDIKELL